MQIPASTRANQFRPPPSPPASISGDPATANPAPNHPKLGSPFFQPTHSKQLIGFVRTKMRFRPNPPQCTIQHKSAQPAATIHQPYPLAGPATARNARPATIKSMDRLQELRRRHAAAEQGGGDERRNRQHHEGKLSARERIDLLLDEGTFEEPAFATHVERPEIAVPLIAWYVGILRVRPCHAHCC